MRSADNGNVQHVACDYCYLVTFLFASTVQLQRVLVRNIISGDKQRLIHLSLSNCFCSSQPHACYQPM